LKDKKKEKKKKKKTFAGNELRCQRVVKNNKRM
jgi:hypothetical protein